MYYSEDLLLETRSETKLKLTVADFMSQKHRKYTENQSLYSDHME